MNWFHSLISAILPPTSGEVARRVNDSGSSSPFRLPNRTLLFVDDDEYIRSVMRRIIGQFECDLTEAADGKTCLALYAPKKWDLIILDLRLPDIDGIELLKSLREQDPEQAIAVFSGYLSTAIIDQLYEVGWVFLGRKPLDLRDGVVLRTMLKTVGIVPKRPGAAAGL
jgi:CheY-like chemotaxis protein